VISVALSATPLPPALSAASRNATGTAVTVTSSSGARVSTIM
jgi:hypothetical protein